MEEWVGRFASAGRLSTGRAQPSLYMESLPRFIGYVRFLAVPQRQITPVAPVVSQHKEPSTYPIRVNLLKN